MKTFAYKGLDGTGNLVNGTVSGSDESDITQVISELRESGIYPTQVTELAANEIGIPTSAQSFLSMKLSGTVSENEASIERGNAWYMLGLVLSSGVPRITAISTVTMALRHPKNIHIFECLKKGASEGSSIALSVNGLIPVTEVVILQLAEITGNVPHYLTLIRDVTENAITDDLAFEFSLLFPLFLETGFGVIKSLEEVRSSYPTDSEMYVVLGVMIEDFRSGSTFYEVIKKHPKHFSGIFVEMIHAGEIAGILDVTLREINREILKEYSRFTF